MIGLRDLVWSALICAALTLMFQCRPAWNARRALERDAREAFLETYKGHRDLGGEVIAPAGKGVHDDPMASPIAHRRFAITAERLSWSGTRAELVAVHEVELAGGEPVSTVEAHVKLEKRGSRWIYTLFEVRDGPALGELDIGNPWLRALRPPSEEEQEEEPEYEQDAAEQDDG